MINRNHITPKTESTLHRLLEIRAVQLLLAGVYFLLGVTREPVYEVRRVRPRRYVNRSRRLRCERTARLSRSDNRDVSPLRKFLPKGLTPNQFNERCTRLSHMGRFQIYNWLYYRWEFWRIGAIAKRCRSTLPASGAVGSLQSFGLSAAHLGPD